MKILLDVNVWLDIAARPKNYPKSSKLYESLESKGFTICFPLSGYTTLYYLLTQLISDQAAIEFINTLEKRGIRFLPFTDKEFKLAHKFSFRDHEDACVTAIAFSGNCDYIITRNTKDFKKSPVKAISPDSALKVLFE